MKYVLFYIIGLIVLTVTYDPLNAFLLKKVVIYFHKK